MDSYNIQTIQINNLVHCEKTDNAKGLKKETMIDDWKRKKKKNLIQKNVFRRKHISAHC